MSGTDYKRLLYELGKEISNDSVIELDLLKYICEDKIQDERLGAIDDVFTWLKELERSGNLSIDNLEFLKQVLQTLEKHRCLEKVVAFETRRQSAALAIQISRNPGSSRFWLESNPGPSRTVIAAGGEADNLVVIDPAAGEGSLVAAPATALERSEKGSASFGAVSAFRQAARKLLGARTELRGVKSASVKRRMSDSFLMVKSTDDTKLSSQDRLRLQRAEMTATAEAKRRELLEKELEKFMITQHQRDEYEFKQYKSNEYVSEYLKKLESGSSSGATESGYRTRGSSVVDPSELETEPESYDPGECRLEHLPEELLQRVCDGFTTEMTAMEVILKAFGLPVFVSHSRVEWMKSMMFGILKKYSATPVRLIRDVCSSLLDDESLVQSLDEAILSHNPRPAVRLVRPLEEVTYTQKARVLVIGDDLVEYDSAFGGYSPYHEGLVSFFKELDPTCEVIKIPLLTSSDAVIEYTLQSLRHEGALSFYVIFLPYLSFLHRIQGLEEFLYNCNQIKIIVTTEEHSRFNLRETVLVSVRSSFYSVLSTNSIASIFKQHWRNEDVWSMLKRYKRDHLSAILTSTLTSKVMFKESTRP